MGDFNQSNHIMENYKLIQVQGKNFRVYTGKIDFKDGKEVKKYDDDITDESCVIKSEEVLKKDEKNKK